jgi:anti-sigma regulatory factor (Ser/Thr protein kinase)
VENAPSGYILPDNPGLTARALLGPLIADAPIGLALVDDNFRYVFINETQAGFNERPVPEHLGKTVGDVLGGAAWEQLSPFFHRALSGLSLRAHEVTRVSSRQPGVLRHYLISFYPVRSDRRTVTGVGTVVTDITERKQSEALIAGQNRILEGIATDVPLVETLTALSRLIEEQVPGFSTMVLQTQNATGRLTVAAAPRLSREAAASIWEDLESELASGPGAGVRWPREGVMLPLTPTASGRTLPDGLPDSPLTCWITPIFGEKKEILGALGVVLSETRETAPREHSLVDSAVNTARIAMERDRELVRRRQLLRDMLGSLTEGRLVLCLSPDDLPAPLPIPIGETMTLSKEVLRELRRNVSAVASRLNMSDERRHDLEVAVGEASMNAVVHAGTGTAQTFTNEETGRVQVWVRDTGPGIAEETLHRATLERGFSTGGTLGHGFWMILNTIDRVYLLTGPEGTTIVLEHDAHATDTDWMSVI